jgi:hypothetical protein
MGADVMDVSGFYDLHVHSAPAPFKRIGDSAQIALWAAESGLAGIVLKSHFESTVSKAHHARTVVQDAFPDFQVYSSISLNRGVGGVNPGAVEIALQQGAKTVWLPTLDSAHHVDAFGAAGTYGTANMTLGESRKPFRGFTVLDQNGALSGETREVLDMVASHGAILGTGHVSPREIVKVVDYATSAGVKNIVITHPELKTPNLDIPAMKDLASAGCVMEFCAIYLLPVFPYLKLDWLIEAIEAVGPARAIISSDGGQPFHPKPAECLRIAACALEERGIPHAVIAALFIDNPRMLLGLGR